jgi:hypothetical protein
VSDRSGVSRGDRNRNARLARLREAVPVTNAIAGIDLADSKQMVVVTDHESRVLARRTFRRRAWELGAALDWAAARAAAAGFAGVSERGMAFVCVQPLMSAWARRAEPAGPGRRGIQPAPAISSPRCYPCKNGCSTPTTPHPDYPRQPRRLDWESGS